MNGTGSSEVNARNLSPAFWWATAKRTWAEAGDDNLGLIAAGTAFYAFTAFVPILAATVLTYGLVADPATVAADMRSLFQLLPADAASVVGDQLGNVVKTSDGKKGLGLIIAIAIAFYGSTKGTGSIITAVNIAYDEEEERGFIALNLTSLALTVGGVALLIIVLVGAAAMTFLRGLVPGAPDAVLIMLRLAGYVITAAIIAVGAACLYRFAPDRRDPQWQWLSPGALLATLVWLAATTGFGYYVSNFGNYGATYGSLGAVIVLLTWLWLSAYVFLLGAELNGVIERVASESRQEHDEPGRDRILLAKPVAAKPSFSGVVLMLLAGFGLGTLRHGRRRSLLLTLLATIVAAGKGVARPAAAADKSVGMMQGTDGQVAKSTRTQDRELCHDTQCADRSA